MCSDIQGFKDQSEGDVPKSVLTIIKFFTSELSQFLKLSTIDILC